MLDNINKPRLVFSFVVLSIVDPYPSLSVIIFYSDIGKIKQIKILKSDYSFWQVSPTLIFGKRGQRMFITKIKQVFFFYVLFLFIRFLLEVLVRLAP